MENSFLFVLSYKLTYKSCEWERRRGKWRGSNNCNTSTQLQNLATTEDEEPYALQMPVDGEMVGAETRFWKRGFG